jgi:hypothetical protein
MQTKTILTRSGYWITIQLLNKEWNSIFIRDSNLYPDSDSRSEETREWIIPINDIDDLKKIAKEILELTKKKK